MYDRIMKREYRTIYDSYQFQRTTVTIFVNNVKTRNGMIKLIDSKNIISCSTESRNHYCHYYKLETSMHYAMCNNYHNRIK